jgi:hypothetical protein
MVPGLNGASALRENPATPGRFCVFNNHIMLKVYAKPFFHEGKSMQGRCTP